MNDKSIICWVFILFAFQTTFAQSVNNKTVNIDWTEPEQIIEDDSLQPYLFHVNLTETKSGIYAFGNSMVNPKKPEEYDHLLTRDKDKPLIALGPEGPIEVPEGSYSFSYPQIVADSKGVIHMLWGEPDTLFSKKPDADFTSIWYARYFNDSWSDPTKIYKANEIEWQPNQTSGFFIDNKGIFHLLFVTNKNSRDDKGIMRRYTGIMHLFKDEDGWHNTFWTSRRAYSCGYLDLAVQNYNDQLFMACIGPDWETPGDQNSVFFSSSEDKGKTWAEPRLISLSGPDLKRAVRLKIIYTNKTIHLVWGQSEDRGILPETFGHAYSLDSGKTWSEVHFLETDATGSIMSQKIVADTKGKLHLIYESRENLKKYYTYYRMWNGNQWTRGLEIYPNKNINVSGELIINKNGDLLFPTNQFKITEKSNKIANPVKALMIIGKQD